MRKDKISCVNGLFLKQMHFANKGDVMEGHSHIYDHQTLLAYGSLEADVNGTKTIFIAPQVIFIKAGVNHMFTALEPNTVAYCIHPLESHDDKEDIVDLDGVPYSVEFQPGKFRPLVTE